MALTEDQTAVIEFLAAPSTHDGASVDQVETHISIVFLAGPRAWKLKRAVQFDYIDASTVDRRKMLCEREVQLNRRTAPSLYLDVVAITRQANGSLGLGSGGTPIDWVVGMNRFDQDALFDRLAQQGRLDVRMMVRLAVAVAAFHRDAAARRDHGGVAGMRWVIDGNAAGFHEFGAGLLDVTAVERLVTDTRGALEAAGSVLERRRQHGFVRQCHGDLHLRNIVLHEGNPTLFDGVEFNDEIACGDVLYDLAFLLMDLWRRSLPGHANTVWNGYLSETADFGGIGLMPLFLSCRAAIRAKTSATTLRMQSNGPRVRELESAAREYMAMAGRLLRPPPPCLVAVGGLSGSGKSTLARALSPHVGAVPGAIVLRSDEIRKQSRGVPMFTRLGSEAYMTGVTNNVYSTLMDRAGLVLDGGFSAIADATFLRVVDRHAIEDLARSAAFPFIGLWLEAPERTLLERLEARERDVSDADGEVLRTQLAQDIGAIAWHKLDSSAPVDVLREKVVSLLQGHVNDAPAQPTTSAVHQK